MKVNKGKKQQKLLKSILIDYEDRHLFDEYSIFLSKQGYIVCNKMINYKKYRKYLHQLIVPSKGIIDHINGNTLDNRKCNLRIVTASLNLMNRPKRSDSNQIYKGIQKLPSGKYRAKGPNGVHWGVFDTPEQARNKWKLNTEKIHNIIIKESDYAYA